MCFNKFYFAEIYVNIMKTGANKGFVCFYVFLFLIFLFLPLFSQLSGFYFCVWVISMSVSA